jgi:tetratricopeptide (TPR) repeat protein
MAAFALIKRAEALRTEIHFRLGPLNQQDLTTQINLAKDSYNEAIKRAASLPSLLAEAKFGLGLCEEELGNFEAAQKIYQDVATNPDFEQWLIIKQRLFFSLLSNRSFQMPLSRR